MISVAPSKNISSPVPTEGSQFRPARDQSDVRMAWKGQKKHRDSIVDQTQAIETLARSIEKIRRRILGGSSTGKGMIFRGEFDPTASYQPQDVVVIRAGANAGSYVCILQTDTNPDDPTTMPQLPDTGNQYWINLNGNAPVMGAWL